VAITGAGISTPSGIPDFRSANSGLWENVDPNVATLSYFRRHPDRFFQWVRPLVETILRATPNAAHRALADLEQSGPLQAIVTQNIDMLHEDAGSKVVHEVHGHMREATCLSCRRTEPGRQHIREFIATGRLPHCSVCGNILKPNVILFGEMLPWQTYRRAEKAVHDADLVIVAGSSLEVAPVNELPLYAKRTGAAIIIVNRDPTIMDHLADLVIHQDVVDVLPPLAEAYHSQHP
jgi:NAD-dependent deacetylase